MRIRPEGLLMLSATSQRQLNAFFILSQENKEFKKFSIGFVTGRRGTAAWHRRYYTAKIQSISRAQVRKGSTTNTGRPACHAITFDASTWPCPTVEAPAVFCCTTDSPFTATSTRRRVVTSPLASAVSPQSRRDFTCC